MSDKIKTHHVQRKAILYIRQSSPHQVQHNQESRRLQYAMKERLEQLGWREIEIIDDDLGRTAAGTVTPQRSADGRPGRLDRPAHRHVPLEADSAAAPAAGPAADGPPVPAIPLRCAEDETVTAIAPAAFWALLPPNDREQIGLRLSRLVLKALGPLELAFKEEL